MALGQVAKKEYVIGNYCSNQKDANYIIIDNARGKWLLRYKAVCKGL
jgi:hypothetical protein